MRQLVYEHSDGGAQARLPVDRVRRADHQAVGKVVERVAQDNHQRQRRLRYKNRIQSYNIHHSLGINTSCMCFHGVLMHNKSTTSTASWGVIWGRRGK